MIQDKILNDPNYCMGNRSLWEKFLIAWRTFSNPWLIFWDKLGLVKNPVYKTTRGVVIQTRGQTTDVNDAVVVLSGNEYPPKLVNIDSKPNPIVIDCGGHIGSFSLYVKTLNPQVKIWVLEPVKENLILLQKNFSLNNQNDIQVIPKALYTSRGQFYIDLHGKSLDAGQLVTKQPTHADYVSIQALTPEDLWSNFNIGIVDLFKMDIEGSEYAILTNYAEFFALRVKRLIMEYHPTPLGNGRDILFNALCSNHFFSLVYETKNVLGFDSLLFD